MTQFASVIALSSLDGTTGFRLAGSGVDTRSGWTVAAAGDVNNDGFGDVIVGAPSALGAGASYVVFGQASGFASSINLSALNGTTGFKLSGGGNDRSGTSVASAGDFNGDGFADVIVGAPYADPNGTSSGASYVVFGAASGFASNITLSALNGTNGVRLNGVVTQNHSGFSVASAGDVNGDGFDDVIIGAPDANSSYGASYVVFGAASGFGSSFNLSALDGTNGFKISGELSQDQAGFSVSSAGDLNGDGFADLILGVPYSDGINTTDAGTSYILFGKASGFSADIDLASLSGSDGFKLTGTAVDDRSGTSVSAAGDVNGDGFADVIIGAWGADPHGATSGASYVLFGKASGLASVELSTLNGTNGFKISGAAEGDHSGWSVSGAGDVNGDGFADLIVGANYANGLKGASYVIFGQATVAANIDLSALDGNTGFRLDGVAASDYSGSAVSAAGDVNGDGFADLIVGAPYADPNGSATGASYVVFGHKPLEAVSRTGTDIGNTIRGGDFNDTLSGLGGDDKLVGYDGDDTLDGGDGENQLTGGTGDDTYVVSSADDVILELAGEGTDEVQTSLSVFSIAAMADVENLTGTSSGGQRLTGSTGANVIAGGGGNDVISGGNGDDTLNGGGGNDTLNGGAGADAMDGGAGNDRYYVDNAGDTVTDVSGVDLIYTTIGYSLDDGIERLYARSDAGLVLDGNGANNVIVGRGGSDTLSGGDGNDVLNGGVGADAMDGGAGDDRYYVDNAGDTATDSSGLDSVFTTVDHSLGAGIERLYARSDTGLALTGSGADNTIVGRGGNDTITGGAGRDVVTGGAGGDTFVFQALSDSAASALRDVIRDFQIGADKIDLTAIDADSALGGDQAFSFIGAGAFTHTAGELQAKAFGVNTLISGDVDGNGRADFQVLLSGNVALQATDFLL